MLSTMPIRDRIVESKQNHFESMYPDQDYYCQEYLHKKPKELRGVQTIIILGHNGTNVEITSTIDPDMPISIYDTREESQSKEDTGFVIGSIFPLKLDWFGNSLILADKFYSKKKFVKLLTGHPGEYIRSDIVEDEPSRIRLAVNHKVNLIAINSIISTCTSFQNVQLVNCTWIKYLPNTINPPHEYINMGGYFEELAGIKHTGMDFYKNQIDQKNVLRSHRLEGLVIQKYYSTPPNLPKQCYPELVREFCCNLI